MHRVRFSGDIVQRSFCRTTLIDPDALARIVGRHLTGQVDDRALGGAIGRHRRNADHAGHRGIKAARSQYDAWLDIVTRAEWRNPEDFKASYPKASILKAGRVVFNIKGNDYRLIARVQYQASVLMIRFFGTHAEYDGIDAETV